MGEKWWRLQGGRDDNGGGAVANVIALPRSFPRVRGNQENNEWLGCSATALSRRERNSDEREKERNGRSRETRNRVLAVVFSLAWISHGGEMKTSPRE